MSKKKKTGRPISGDPRQSNQTICFEERVRKYKNYFDTMFDQNTPKTIEDFLLFCEKIRDYQFKLKVENNETCSKENWISFMNTIRDLSKQNVLITNMIVPFDSQSSRTFYFTFKGNQISRISVFRDCEPREILSCVLLNKAS